MDNRYLEFKSQQEKAFKEFIENDHCFMENVINEAIHNNGGFAYDYFKYEMDRIDFFAIANRIYNANQNNVVDLLFIFMRLHHDVELYIDTFKPHPVILRAFDLALADHMNKAGGYFDSFYNIEPLFESEPEEILHF